MSIKTTNQPTKPVTKNSHSEKGNVGNTADFGYYKGF
jgi:hypothetical protein